LEKTDFDFSFLEKKKKKPKKKTFAKLTGTFPSESFFLTKKL